MNVSQYDSNCTIIRDQMLASTVKEVLVYSNTRSHSLVTCSRAGDKKRSLFRMIFTCDTENVRPMCCFLCYNINYISHIKSINNKKNIARERNMEELPFPISLAGPVYEPEPIGCSAYEGISLLCCVKNTQFGPVIMNRNEARGVLIWMTWEILTHVVHIKCSEGPLFSCIIYWDQ